MTLPRDVWVTTPRKSIVMGVEGSDKIVVFNQPQQGPTVRKPLPTLAGETRPQRLAPSTKQGEIAPAKSNKTQSIKTKDTSRMDPAVKEALTSQSRYFQDPEFDRLKEYHKNPTINVEQEIQNISDSMEQDFQEIEANIEDILAEDEELFQ